jgi:hypothetical protein
VLVRQTRDSLVPGESPDLWVVFGENTRLPGDVPFAAPWRDLHAAYGPAVVTPEAGVVVTFCRYPRLYFKMQLWPEDELSSVNSIPAGTLLSQVWVNPGTLPVQPACPPSSHPR